MTSDDCPFCEIDPGDILAEEETALAVLDRYPVGEGHSLVIPRRHVASFGDVTEAEWSDLWRLVRRVRDLLAEKYRPDGYNVGYNDGPAAGQG